MNKALLAEWFWKLETEEGIWQTIIKHKYVKGNCISSVRHRAGDSQFWSELLEVKECFFSIARKRLGMEKIRDSGRIGGWMKTFEIQMT
jgi:hypothetical protein